MQELWEILVPFFSNGGEKFSLEHHYINGICLNAAKHFVR